MDVCQVHEDCKETVVAKVGLPYKNALWVCTAGFNQFVEGQITNWRISSEAEAKECTGCSRGFIKQDCPIHNREVS